MYKNGNRAAQVCPKLCAMQPISRHEALGVTLVMRFHRRDYQCMSELIAAILLLSLIFLLQQRRREKIISMHIASAILLHHAGCTKVDATRRTLQARMIVSVENTKIIEENRGATKLSSLPAYRRP